MARTPSNMIALDTVAPAFNLLDTVSGEHKSLAELSTDKKATVIMFICNHCPFVVHLHDKLTEVIQKYSQQNIQFIAISSNDVENYPDDSPDKMKLLVEELNWNIPYLYDESQEIAKAYNAACTPDFYIYNSANKLEYRGQFCDSRPGSDIPVTGEDLSNALDHILNNQPIENTQKPSLGCNIKWKASN